MLTNRTLTRAIVAVLLLGAAQLSWAVAKEIIIPGAASQAGQSISFTTAQGEPIRSEGEARDGDLVVTVYFSGDAGAGDLSVGNEVYSIPRGNGAYEVPASRPIAALDPVPLFGLPDGGVALQIGWVLNEAALDPFTSHAIELRSDGEFPIAESDDAISTDGVQAGFRMKVGPSILSLRYQQLEGDDSYGGVIPAGTGTFAIVNDDFQGGAPGGSTGACCDTGISSWNELDLEVSRFDVEMTLPWSFPAFGDGAIVPHVGFGFTSTELDIASSDAFVTPGLEGVNTASDASFESDAYRLSLGADLVHPCGERWGTMLRLGAGVQYTDYEFDLNQNINLFTPQPGTAVSDSDNDYSVGLYGAAGVYVDITPNVRLQAAFEFDTGFDQPAGDINTTGDNLFVDNKRSAVDLESDTNYGVRVTLQAAVGGRR